MVGGVPFVLCFMSCFSVPRPDVPREQEFGRILDLEILVMVLVSGCAVVFVSLVPDS